MSWQCGVKNCVAISGTGFTEQHLESLRKLSDTAIVSFDNDDAGRKALERTLSLFNAFDFHTKVISLKNFKDPADALLKDQKFMEQAIIDARPAFQFLFQTYFGSEKIRTDVALKKRIIHRLLEILSSLKSSIERSEWLRELSHESGIPETSLDSELDLIESQKKRGDESESEKTKEVRPQERRIDVIARQLLSLAFTNDEFKDIVLENKEFMPQPFLSVLQNPGAESAIVFQMQSTYLFGTTDNNDLKNEAKGLIRQLQLEYYRDVQETLKREMKNAEAKGEEEKLLEATRKFQDCTQKINSLTINV